MGGGLGMRTSDLARLGYLVLRKGTETYFFGSALSRTTVPPTVMTMVSPRRSTLDPALLQTSTETPSSFPV